jgi:hypothetical protein
MALLPWTGAAVVLGPLRRRAFFSAVSAAEQSFPFRPQTQHYRPAAFTLERRSQRQDCQVNQLQVGQLLEFTNCLA